MSEPRVLYFGCIGRPGHFLWTDERTHARHDPLNYPPSLHSDCGPGAKLDGIIRVGSWNDPQVEGQARVLHIDGWTIIGWWDRSVDQRGGSNSVFLAEGEHDPAVMLSAAQAAFPSVFARFRYEVVLP